MRVISGLSIASGLALTSMSVFGAQLVYAVHNTGQFELDGNINRDASTAVPYDWGSLFDASGHRLVTPNPPGGPLLASVFLSDVATPDSSYFSSNGAGVKDIDAIANWGCTTLNNPLNKDDIQNAYAALVKVPANAPENAGHTVLYMGSERGSNNGTSFAGFWLFKDKGVACDQAAGHFVGQHSDGDILVVSDYTNGGGVQDVSVYQWAGGPNGAPVLKTSGNICSASLPNDEACAIANAATVTSPWAPTSHDSNTFVETGVDLTQLLGSGGGCFTTFQAETRSSNQLTATLKDFTGGQFNTCVQPPITTTANPGGSSNVPGTPQHDDASVSGTPTPTGTLTFFLCGPAQVTAGGCPSGGTQVGSPMTLSKGAAMSTTVNALTTPNDLALGKYCWRAEYTPDTGSVGIYLPSSDTNADTECFSIVKASPTISTSAAVTAGPVGTASTSDTVTLHSPFGAPEAAPADQVTFHLWGPLPLGTTPNAGSCTNEVGAAQSTVHLSQSAPLADWTATSASFTPQTAGVYVWTAVYPGDTLNNAVSEPCAGTGESVSVPATHPTITTQASSTPSPIVVGTQGSVSDTATFHNAFQPTGSLTFTLYNNDCSASTGVTGSGAISSGVASFTSSFTPTAVGTYQWKVHYAGDANNDAVDTNCGDPNEQLTVIKASPSIATQASPTSSIVVGSSAQIGDTATFSNGFNVSGSVTFTLYKDNSCTTAEGVSGSGPISSNSASFSTTHTFTAVGTYYWRASYAGDANNNGFTTGCLDANEQLTVIKASPSITTQASPTTALVVGHPATVGDTATFHNGFQVSGSVSFALFSDNTCSTAVQGVSGSGTISNNSAAFSTSWTPGAPGTYYWRASYAGDANNNGFTTGCLDANEQLFVKAAPTITTQASPTSPIVVGTPNVTIGDTATFHNAVTPSGSVSFELFSDNSCTSSEGVSGSGTISNGTATFSTTHTFTAVGTYYWIASYAGDSNNAGFTTGCLDANEQLEVIPASPSITTQASPTTTITVGVSTTVGDTATFHNAFTPSGTVSFTLYSDNTCTTPVAGVSGSGAISNGSASYSTTHTFNQAGTYFWLASYAGDANNNPFTTACGAANEQISVGKASPRVSTQASPTSPIVVGTPNVQIGDTANLAGGVNATGSVTFTLYKDNTCTTSEGVSGSGTVSNDSASFSTTHTFTAVGTYYWLAVYSGDANNFAFTTGCTDANEQLTVIKASPSIVTQASPTSSIVVGTNAQIGDTATLSNGFNASGSVTFTLFSDNTCDTATGVSGSGTISNNSASFSTTHTFTAVGTYYWIASYAGDSNNDPFTTGCTDANEQLTVIKASPSITTQASPTTALDRGEQATVGDTATFHNAFQPTGDVAFTLFSDDTCTTAVAGISGSGTISNNSASFSTSWTPDKTGTFHWIAVYAGDANNNGFTTKCGDDNEQLSVVEPNSALTKAQRDVTASGAFTADPISTSPGSVLEYRLTFTNSGAGAADNVVITDTVPTHTTFVSCENSCTTNGTAAGSTVTWNLGTVAGGGTDVVTFKVKLDANFPTGTTTITNAAVATDTQEGQKPSNQVLATVTIQAQVQALPPNTGADVNLTLGLGLISFGLLTLLTSVWRRRRGMVS